ncbi:MAG TPA: hypothetical protein PLU39_11845 [Armatimonadota bacterium]|nr:hypothetical protein [Armatimonadota bacterium]
MRPVPEQKAGASARQAILTRRTAAIFLPTIAVLAYFTTYSECVVAATSFHSLSPPMNIVLTLAILAGVIGPGHRALRRGSKLADAGLAVLLFLLSLIFADMALLFVSSLTPELRQWLPERLGPYPALAATAILYLPARMLLRRSEPLRPSEMLSVYVMLMVGTLVTSYGVIHFMVPTITSPYYFTSPENRWETLFGSHLVSWLHISNPDTVRAFWESGRWGVPWAQFLRPLAAWLVFIVAAIWVMLCLMSLAARQWTDSERLTFPLVYLPLEIVRPEATQRGGFFRSPLMWAGVAVPVILHAINGLHVYFPSVPALMFRHYNLGQFFQQRPWNAIGYLDITFYPNLVGFTYLLTMEVSFSCWFFFLLRKLEPVLGAATGYSDTATAGGFTFPFIDQQATGAFLGIAVLGVWVGRRHFAEIVRQALRDPRAGEGVAPMPYRSALLGALGGAAFLVLWARAAGLSLWVGVAFFALFFAWCVALSRIRAEAGLGGITGPMTPQETMFMAGGHSLFGVQNLTVLATLRWLTTDLRSLASVMPAQMDDFKIAESGGLQARTLPRALVFAAVAAFIITLVIYLPIVFRTGGVKMSSQRFLDVPVTPFRQLATSIASPREADRVATFYTAFGFAFSMLLSWLRLKFLWWPFHPIGYAVGFSRRTIEWMWFSLFLGWFLKLLVIRAGGLKAYRHMMPFFLGMILGEFGMGVIFGVLGSLWPETAGYQLYP